jgi:hypothetical protein
MDIPLMFGPRCGHGIGCDRQSTNVKFFINESTDFVESQHKLPIEDSANKGPSSNDLILTKKVDRITLSPNVKHVTLDSVHVLAATRSRSLCSNTPHILI